MPALSADAMGADQGDLQAMTNHDARILRGPPEPKAECPGCGNGVWEPDEDIVTCSAPDCHARRCVNCWYRCGSCAQIFCLWHLQRVESAWLCGSCATDEGEQMADHIHTGLSYSGINDLMISPLRYWARHIDPKREVTVPTPAMQFGSALHAAVLEPDSFDSRYCEKFVPPEDALVTVSDLRGWLKDHGIKPAGTRKDDLIEQVQNKTVGAVIASELAGEYEECRYGLVQFPREDWRNILAAARALADEPLLAEILDAKDGRVEVEFQEEYNGIQIKGRMDWVTPTATLDVKTITTRNKEPFDKAVTKAIWFEGYYRQAYLYSLARAIQAGGDPPRAAKAPRFIFAFVESIPPHETRLREMSPKVLGEVNMLWERARIEVESAMDTYRDCLEEFGADEKPWRWAQKINPLDNEEFPALMY